MSRIALRSREVVPAGAHSESLLDCLEDVTDECIICLCRRHPIRASSLRRQLGGSASLQLFGKMELAAEQIGLLQLNVFVMAVAQE